MAGVKIISINCQGLHDYKKRKDVFQFYRQQKCNILCLQDTHFTEEMENNITNEWGYTAYFNSFSSQSRGVAILFNNNFDFIVHRKKSDDTGNFLALDLTIENSRISLITIYGPNEDDPNFYEKISDTFEEFNNRHTIVVGDFNLVINSDVDYTNYLHINNPKTREKVLEMVSTYNLLDVFREINPDKLRYTWRKPNPFKQARLDFFLISQSLLSMVEECNILTSYRSDHSPVMLNLKFDEFKHSKGLWKFNNSLLQDIEYIEAIRQIVSNIKAYYSLPIYNKSNIENITDEEIQFIIDDQLFLETLLLEIRGKTISYSSYKKKKINEKEKNLIAEITKLEINYEQNLQSIQNKKKELENIRNHKLMGNIIRSRAKWLDEGEKPTNYFLNLENRHYTNKIIPKLINENNNKDNITEQSEIFKEVESFYKNLYTRNTHSNKEYNLNELLVDTTVDKLDYAEMISLEGEITHGEAASVLINMSNNKSPGSDGFTTEFFKFFWKQLGHFIVRSLNFGYKKGELSVTQKQGIITCITKEGKSKFYIKNWRPITLLNVVYKIGSGCIAQRIKNILEKIICTDQTGFIPGRYIGENTRLIFDLMHYVEENDIPGILLLVDFEKAFDTISWKFIDKALSFFNFGPSIKKWISVFQSNTLSAVIQAGCLSNFFKLERGCRQGDPISPYLFLICAEILSIKIKNNKNIKGIKINKTEYLISQYADDTVLILDGSENSLNEAIKELNMFYALSGLKINLSKTQATWIGSKKYSIEKMCKNINLQWTTTFKLLGIYFDVDLTNILKMNYDKKLVKIKNTIKYWEKRIITPLGKITLIKSLLISQLNHLFISLPTPSSNFLKQLKEILFNFLWNSKVDKIKRKQITQDYEMGGTENG